MTEKQKLVLARTLAGLAIVLLFAVITIIVFAPNEDSPTVDPAPVRTIAKVEMVTAEPVQPTPTPTPARIPTPQSVEEAPRPSRQEVYRALENLNIGLLPLDKSGTDDWWSTRLPNGGITSIDIFGHADRVDAVEMWFTPMVQPTALLVVEALVATMVPNHQALSMLWFRDSMSLGTSTATRKPQKEYGGMYLTLLWVPKLNQYFFSIDEEKR